jgi:hypothetical protein
MQLQPFRALKKLFAVATLTLVVGSAALAGGAGVASAEETCVSPTFGTTVCTESFVLDVQTYSVEVESIQSCQKGKSTRPAQQQVITLDTHEVTEYQIVTQTFAFGNLASVEYTREFVDVLTSSETISVGKCGKVKS